MWLLWTGEICSHKSVFLVHIASPEASFFCPVSSFIPTVYKQLQETSFWSSHLAARGKQIHAKIQPEKH